MSESLWAHGLQPASLLCPWDFPGKNTGVGLHFLFQEIYLPNPGIEPTSLSSPPLAGGFFTISPPGKPYLQLPQIHNVPRNCSALKQTNKNSVFLCPRFYGQTSAPVLRVRSVLLLVWCSGTGLSVIIIWKASVYFPFCEWKMCYGDI